MAVVLGPYITVVSRTVLHTLNCYIIQTAARSNQIGYEEFILLFY